MTRFGKVVKLKGFKPFTSAANALGEINQISDSICSEDLKNFLEMNLPKVGGGLRASYATLCCETRCLNATGFGIKPYR